MREAINAANSTANSGGRDLIHFNVPPTDPNCNTTTKVCTISPGTSLPDLTDPVIINGYTQPGAKPNTLAVGDNAELRIRLDGDYPDKVLAGLRIAANGCVVRGLSITRFFTALPILGTDNNKIEGNFVGTDPGGTQPLGSPNSVRISGDGANNNTIGGTSPDARNIISGNDFGLVISGSGNTGNKVLGNYIGTTKSGSGDLGNRDWGLIIGSGASNNLVGGASSAAANIIAFNGEIFNRDGVAISDANSTHNPPSEASLPPSNAASSGSAVGVSKRIFGVAQSLIGAFFLWSVIVWFPNKGVFNA